METLFSGMRQPKLSGQMAEKLPNLAVLSLLQTAA
jgi:hypothetical protein